MPPDQYSQNNNGTYNNPYTPGGYEKSKLKKILIIVVCVFVCVGVVALVVHLSQSDSQQNRYIKSATAAARELNPNAEVDDIKVAGGFALASVSDPTASGQAKSGNTTIFRINKDGSMKQIASGSSFSPIDLLELGMPLTTQAKLSGNNPDQAKQNLANTCNYSGTNAPGYSGFDSSFDPGGWRISTITLGVLEQTLTDVIGNKNSVVKPDKKIICVNAVRSGSSNTNGVFTIEVQLITGDGTLTTHKLAYTIDGLNRNFTLDGKKLPSE